MMAARFVFLFRTAGILAIGGVGGSLAQWIGLPMPYLTGSLAFVAAFTIFRSRKGARAVQFPPLLRMTFVAVIGTMIGATFTTDLLAVVPSLGLSMTAMVLFVVIALAGNYALFRRLGRYDRTTAFFAAMPGGLVEAVSLGEQAGGDVRVLSVQHFARIVLVVMIVPLLFLLWTGETVGSASGQSFEQHAYRTVDIFVILMLAAAGMALGPRLRLPAAHMVGPLVLSAAAHVSGLVDLNSPAWLLNLAQLVVGSGLGSTFAGSTGRQLIRAFSLGAVSTVLMLALGIGFAMTLSRFMLVPVDALFISFAPGGVTEMGLIALSLGVSPVVVACHHLFRIFVTVLVAGTIARKSRRRASAGHGGSGDSIGR
ncbi:MAG: AbrB family transcriptional regulator [Boseongicola sp.]|nr:AbrB family transcriptional regulator [Boseongicola sp.]